MLNTRSFSDILNELSPSENDSFSDYSGGWESHLEAFGLSQIMQIMSQTSPLPSVKTGVQRAYPFKSRPKIKVIRPSHQLNEVQLSALQVLQNHCPSLADNFDFQELKKAYRKSVIKTHPDHGGSSESFQQVRKSYQILSALVKN